MGQQDNGDVTFQLISVGCTIGMGDGLIRPQTVVHRGMLSRRMGPDYIHVLDMDESCLERLSPADRADVLRVRKHQARTIIKSMAESKVYDADFYSFTFADGTTSLYPERFNWLEKISGVMEVK